ncbi:SDR family NAD(P)-dependent oxidoreductase [Halorientalis pallida]|uniref:SDR family NAD(P)-dependent oxidoreductase n=1 Tax=Halorientalis pallida TaxID=2479928 RepID=UPI003C702D30
MSRTAVIAGVGPGLGESIARRFADEGCRVGLFARSESYLDDLAADLDETPGAGLTVPTDLTDPDEIADGFAAVREAFGPVDILVNHASAASWDGLTDISAESFDRALAVGPKAALHCAQEAVPDMLDSGGGTVIFTGATTSVRGREGAVGFSAAKFACRGMAESMARELGPEGVHVAHVVLDGMIRPPDAEDDADYLDPDAIADSYWHLVEQDRSAWTLELDLRPHVEDF